METKAKLPEVGDEKTGKQTGSSQSHFSSDAYPGFSAVPPAGIDTYLSMRGNPTLALARAVAQSPIKAASWSYEAADGATDDMVKVVQTELDRRKSSLVKDALLAQEVGSAAFELVFGPVDVDGRAAIGFIKVKPLHPKLTEIVTDKATGDFAGFKQKSVVINRENAWLVTHDGEWGDLSGRPKHENVRLIWSAWMDTLAKEGKYISKVAGVTPMIEYPVGTSIGPQGEKVDNSELAMKVLANLGKGHGVAMPNVLAKYAEELSAQGVDVSQLKAWNISFLETSGSHGADFVSQMKHKESLMMRGWLVPERVAIEGTSGTRAEAGAHADIALIVAQLELDELVERVQELADALLVLNFGEKAKGKVRVRAEKLSDESRALIRQLIVAVLSNPANRDLLEAALDFDAMLDSEGLPKAEEVVDITDADTKPEVEEKAEPDSEAKADAKAKLQKITASILAATK